MEDSEITEEEIKVLIEKGTEVGAIEEAEQKMIEGVFQLGDQRVVSLMRHRNKIAWIDINEDPEAVRNAILSNSYSRFPVAEGDLDHMIGYVHVKDLLGQCISGNPVDLKSYVRQLPGVPEIMTALKALETFKDSGTHIALALDQSVQLICCAIDGLVCGCGTVSDRNGLPAVLATLLLSAFRWTSTRVMLALIRLRGALHCLSSLSLS